MRKNLFILLFLLISWGTTFSYYLPVNNIHYFFRAIGISPFPYAFSNKSGREFQRAQYIFFLLHKENTRFENIDIRLPENIPSKYFLRKMSLGEKKGYSLLPYSLEKTVAIYFDNLDLSQKHYLENYFCKLYNIKRMEIVRKHLDDTSQPVQKITLDCQEL